MKYLKMLMAAAMAAAALMAFASSASATNILVTTNSATDTIEKGKITLTSELKENTEAVLKSSFIGEVKCKKSTVNGSSEGTGLGSSTTTVKGTIEALTFTECNSVVNVLKTGTLELHTEGSTSNGNGLLTSTGTEVTTELSGIHCIFSTNGTTIGTAEGKHEGHVTLEAKSAAIPRTGGRSGAFCGSSATWNAEYTVTALHWEYEPGKTQTFTNFTVE